MEFRRVWKRVVKDDVNGKEHWVAQLVEKPNVSFHFMKANIGYFACMSYCYGGEHKIMFEIVKGLHGSGFGAVHVHLRHEDLGMPRSTFYNHINKMLSVGLLFETDSKSVYEVNSEYLIYGREKRKPVRDADKG